MRWFPITLALVAGLATPGEAQLESVLRFDRSLDDLRKTEQFGVFRNTNDAPSVQFVTETRATRKVGEEDVGFLQLDFVLRKAGSFNGWWWKPRKEGERETPADWSDFRKGALVLRLRPETRALRAFKVEIKTATGVHAAYVRTSPAMQRAVESEGWYDVELPFDEVVDRNERLNAVNEFVVVFEQGRVGVRNGRLLIESILLSPTFPLPKETTLRERMERKAWDYFVDHSHPETGFVLDRAGNLEGAPADNAMSSIAATGYYASVLPAAVERGWITREEAVAEARRILEFAETIPHDSGLFHHFCHHATGQPWGSADEGTLSEVSCLDSGIFLNAAATLAVAFPEVADVANRLIERAEWDKFLVKTEQGPTFLALGRKNGELIGRIDVRTTENAMPLMLACASGKVPVSCWYDTSTETREVAGAECLLGHLPLFVHQYGLGWADLEGLVDRDGIDLHDNARVCSLANRRYCLEKVARRSATFREENGGWWGLSAGDSEDGYVAVGPVFGDSDGTVWPVAALGSIRWIPDVAEADLQRWSKSETYPTVDGRYGLAPFNLDTGWRGKQIIAIDVGAFLVNSINERNEGVSRYWMQHPVARKAIDTIGFVPREDFERE